MKRSHSAAASAKVIPDRTMLAGVARLASSSTSRSQVSAIRFVKYPVGGRPRSVQAGPIRFWNWRPSASLYLAYQIGRRAPSRFAAPF